MPALLNYGGKDDLCPGGLFFSNLTNSSLLLSLAPTLEGCSFQPRKRSRVTAPLFLRVADDESIPKKQRPCSIDVLPDECLFEILRRLRGLERCNSACVSKRWLALLGSIRSFETVEKKQLPDLNGDADTGDDDGIKSEEHLARSLEGKEATDVRLAALAIGASANGGVGKLLIQGSHPTRGITDHGLSAVARSSPSLRILSLWNVPLVTDAGLLEVAKGCPMLEKLDLTQCPLISDKGLIAIARRCPNLLSLTLESCAGVGNEALQAIGRFCPKLNSVTIKNCPLIVDKGVSSLVCSASASLAKIKLQGLNISDAVLAVIGYYGKAVTELTLSRLQNVGERGFWVMANALGLQKLKCMGITSCPGATDLGLASIAKHCPSLKQVSLQRCYHVSDVGLKALFESARALESLQLEECNRVSLIGVLGGLLNCSPKFRALALIKCLGIKDISPGLVQLPSCSSLRSLTIRECPGLTDASLATVGKICPNLEQIELSGLGGLTDHGLLPLLENSEAGLMQANLSGCSNLTDTAIAALVKAHGKTLQLVNLDGCKEVTDKSLLAIADACTVLEELDLSQCMITDYGVAILASARQLELRVLSLAICSKVTQKSLPLLGNMGQSLVGLNLQFCNLVNHGGVATLEEKLWWCDILS